MILRPATRPVVRPICRGLLDVNPGFVIPTLNLAARFDAAFDVTSSAGFASAWADRSGNGRNLLQATGANQPIHLAYSGTKYGWLPGVAGNRFTTPDSAANSITGSIDIRFKLATNWAYGSLVALGGKWGTSNLSYVLYLSATGTLIWYASTDGTTLSDNAKVSTASIPFTNGATGFVRVTKNTTTGDIKFYTSTDGDAWTQLGATVAGGVFSIFNGAADFEIGTANSGSPISATVYRVQVYNGIDGTLAVDFDPSRWTSGTTFTASTGETWTINSTGSKPAQIVDRPSLLFDGSAHYMNCSAFTLNQPETIYLVGKQVTWTNADYFIDGNTNDSMVLYQLGSTPTITLYAGATGPSSTSMLIGEKHVACSVFNGAASTIQVDSNAAATGDASTRNGGGLTLASRATPGLYANIQVYEVLIYNVAHDAATRANVIRALMSKHGVA